MLTNKNLKYNKLFRRTMIIFLKTSLHGYLEFVVKIDILYTLLTTHSGAD